MTESAVTFCCHGDELIGILHRGSGTERNVGVLIVVGGPQYRVGSHRQFVLMARSFALSGYPVLRFDYRGMGDSEGEPHTFESVDADIKAAIDVFFEMVPSLSGVILFGLCDAASATLMYAKSDGRVLGLILANPWVRTVVGEARSYVRHYYGARLLQRSFWRKVLTGKYRVFRSVRGFMATIATAQVRAPAGVPPIPGHFIGRMLDGLLTFKGPILFVVSGRDLVAQEFCALCRDSKLWAKGIERPDVQIEKLPAADHTFSSSEALRALERRCILWLSEIRWN
jgi:uncharacterized protein